MRGVALPCLHSNSKADIMTDFNPVQACKPVPETEEHLTHYMRMLAERGDYYASCPRWERFLWRHGILVPHVRHWMESERRLHGLYD